MKVKKKLTVVQKRANKEEKAVRQKKYMWVFMNGKQLIIKLINGMNVDE